MRADGAGAKTWLLAALAGWALCVWLLALFGLGGRVDRLPADQALVQALPVAPKSLPERLGPLPQYDEIGARPLFATDRKPHPFFINPQGEDDGKGDFDFVLTSVLRTPAFEMAIVQPSEGGDPVRLKVGEAPKSASAWTLASLAPRSAVFNGPEGPRTLELRVFDGEGAIAPTAMAIPPPTPPRNGVVTASGTSAGRPPPPSLPSPPPRMADRMGMPLPDPASGMQDADGPPPLGEGTADAAQPGSPASNRENNSQIDAIRKRIEERRAKLRADDEQ